MGEGSLPENITQGGQPKGPWKMLGSNFSMPAVV